MDQHNSPTPYSTGGIAGHPKGLNVLFFTEFWERFSFYGMRALLILFMVAPIANGGYGLSTLDAAVIYGWYTALVYAACIPGGWLADRFLGQRRAIFYGAIIITLGHIALIFHSMSMFYLGLALIIIGTGLLKPNISAIVGGLYAKEDPRRDAGFSIFYLGINLGAFFAPLLCGWAAAKLGWHVGFSLAAIGMGAGVFWFKAGSKYFGDVGLAPKKASKENPSINLKEPFTSEEWKRLGALGLLFVFATFFWAAFEQAGSSLNLFADQVVDNTLFGWEVPAAFYQSVNPFFIMVLTPVFAWLWANQLKGVSSGVKFAFGLIFVGLGFLVIAGASTLFEGSGMKVSPLWLVGCYFLHTTGELCLSPIGLSTVTKLAPARIVSVMMGGWFLSISFGNKLGGWIAGFFDTFPLPKLFMAVTATTVCAGIILLIISGPIKRLAGEGK